MRNVFAVIFLALFLPLASYGGQASDAFYAQKLKLMQGQLQSRQLQGGEWAGINEGDPRWDAMFMVYTYELHKWGFKQISREVVRQVVDETIQRFKTWRGIQPNGWALHGDRQVDKRLTGSILLALNHVDPGLVQRHFPSQQSYWDRQGWSVRDMSVLDRVIFRMMRAPGHIMLPPVVPSMFALNRSSRLLNTASLGYYRWGFIAVTVWDWFDHNWQIGVHQEPIRREFLERKGEYVSHPERTRAVSPDFWAREGLMWLLQRPFGDGNPSPTLIVQQAFFAAHRAGVMDLTHEIERGWNYMNDLRKPMRNGVRVFQPSISPVWDTARVIKAIDAIPSSLRTRAFGRGDQAITKAIGFLLAEQDRDGGDYRMATPQFQPGGWGFAYGGSEYPDSDDTAMVVDAFLPYAKTSQSVLESARMGTAWLLQLQNPNGGWPAWDYNATGSIEYLIQNTKLLPNTSLVPQTDVTARVLRTLKNVQLSGIYSVPQSVFDRGCSFLMRQGVNSRQGVKLWAGTWAVNYLYGTSEALSTLMELGCTQDLNLPQTVAWIQSIQNADGGWGESVDSYALKDFTAGPSSITQTLAALQLLLAYEEMRRYQPGWPSARGAIERGMASYLARVDRNGDISDENEIRVTACYACPDLFVRYDLIPLYMGTEVLGKYLRVVRRIQK